ncbi:recombination directionality factor [Planotetraspora phitsanulokensis]|uniref:Uncharacterized protein n=1 Tax=Planotetraspora phitsanulokensis TaxID=575192 RepID=A0A8J3XK82_9ACTN|nr:hypothetical protein [Planotetraspora phitsanulokensis]GII42846.1 hypothetical protein Pph01_78490 [Planotetraspora phitsanulokensis]
MPIDPSVLQRRHWQDGRIRLGIKKQNQSGKEYPSKIETFRFTSPSEEMIRGVADLYGGQAKPWRSPEGPQFEVITDAVRIPVVVPPNGLSQNMELWESKVCMRRCTGVEMQPPFVGPCLCGADTPVKARPCKPYTRLGVFLKEVPSLGLWRLDSKGKNAAEELPNAAEFLAHAGQYVDAWLYLAKRNGTIIDERTRQPKPTTYMVPGLTIEGVGFHELMSGEVARRAELGRTTTAKAIEAAPATDYLAMIERAENRDQVVAIWQTAKLDPAWKPRAKEVEEAAQARVKSFGQPQPTSEPEREVTHEEEPPETPPPGGYADHWPGSDKPAETPSDPEADRLRQQIMTAWQGTMTELHAAFAESSGTTLKKASVAQLNAFVTQAINPAEPAGGPIADEPRKASERAEALLQAARQQRAAAAPVDEVVDADVIEDEPGATDKQLRDLNVWFTEAGVTDFTGPGSTAKKDEARFAWITEHLGVTVTSTRDLSAAKAREGIKLLMEQAADRRKDLTQRIANVWADMGGTRETLTAKFEQAMEVKLDKASNANFAAFLQKLNNSEVKPDA